MMRSMESAVSGLKAQQTAMDVIGNNIANVNTNGFRSSSTQFKDMFYESLSGGSQNTNPSQVGYGAKVANVSKNMKDGGASTTDKSTDLYLNGSGYFAVSTTATATTPTYLTRVGNLHLNENGYLLDSNGNYVMGVSTTGTSTATTTYCPVKLQTTAAIITPATPEVPIYATYSSTDSNGVVNYYSKKITSTEYKDLRDITFNADGSISATLNSHNVTITTTGGSTGTPITSDNYVPVIAADLTTGHTSPCNLQIALATVVNEDGLTQAGNNYYMTSAGSGPASIGVPKTGNTTEVESGALESSNVDIASEFTTMIKTQRGFQADSRVITTSDSMLEELINLKRS